MKKVLILLAALGFVGGVSLPAQADPASDLKKFRSYFKEKYPNVPFDDYSNGLYSLPQFKELRESWEAINEFPPMEIGFAKGEKMWGTPFPNGKTFASCFRNGGKKIAQRYPYWSKKAQKVVTAEIDLMACAKRNGGKHKFLTANLTKDKKARVQLANLTAYFYSLSKGQRVQLAVDWSDPGARAAYEEGKKFWWARRGQLNFACANCHVLLSGKKYYGGQALSPALGHPLGWPAQRYKWGRLETVHWRYMTCNKQTRATPFKHGAKIYNRVQLYETYMSSGLPLTAPSMRQ